MTQSISDEQEYDNRPRRPSGPFVRLGAKLYSGIRTVQKQIVPYAAEWRRQNAIEMARTDRPLWVVLGDSMAQGIGAGAYDHGWPGQLRQLLAADGREYRLVNLSISGARIADVLEHQLPAMQSLGIRPELVTVMIGSNDLVRRKYRRHAQADFELLLAQLPRGSYVANLLGNGSAPLAMDRRLRQAAADGRVGLVDMRGRGPHSWHGLVAEDHFHPNEAGYREIARVFGEALGL
ncbi:MAG: SGNH/GDSL hydrolase family protein [Candidatus Saccharibacteria bacterium]